MNHGEIITAMYNVVGWELSYHDRPIVGDESAANAIRALLPAVSLWEIRGHELGGTEGTTETEWLKWLNRGKVLYEGIVQYRTEPVTDAWDGLMKDLTPSQMAADLASSTKAAITATASFVGSIIPWWVFAAGATIAIILVSRHGN